MFVESSGRARFVALEHIAALRAAGVRPEELTGLLAWSCGWLDRPEPTSPSKLLSRFRLAAIPPQPLVLTPDQLQQIGYAA